MMTKHYPIRKDLVYLAAYDYTYYHHSRVYPSGYLELYWRGHFYMADTVGGLAGFIVSNLK